MPRALLELLEATADDAAPLEAMAEPVRRDPALTASVLAAANAAAHGAGLGRPDVRQAIQRLGSRTVRSIAACLAVRAAFPQPPGQRPGDLAGFWRHALGVAELARALASASGQADAEEAYLAGLLHDVGQLLLLQGLGADYGRLLAAAGTEGRLDEAERERFATDHAAVAAWLIDQWQLSGLMADAVLFHHRGAEAVRQADALTRIVWAAHAGLDMTDASTDSAADGSTDRVTVAELVGLPEATCARLVEQVQRRVQTLARALGLPEVPAGQLLPVWHAGPGDDTAEDADLRRVRGSAMALAALQPARSDLPVEGGLEALLLAARESARLLFGLTSVVFLLPAAEGSAFTAVPLPGQPEVLERLPVVPDAAGGVCAQAARAKAPRSSFDDLPAAEPRIADLQWCRALRAEGLWALPMSAGGEPLGLMLCGLDRRACERLRPDLGTLLTFAGIVAQGVREHRLQRAREGQAAQQERERAAAAQRRLAHEVGNPLGVIKNHLGLLAARLPRDAETAEDLGILREEIDRVARLVREGGEPRADARAVAGDVDLNALLEALDPLYRHALFAPAGVALALQLQRPMARTRAAADAVRQLVLNLWKNAAAAAPAGSTVSTTTRDGIHIGPQVFVEIEITDAGAGLPADVAAFLRDGAPPPRRAEGHGQGLAIVRSLVERLGGQLRWRSAPGRGTAMAVLLPQSGSEAA